MAYMGTPAGNENDTPNPPVLATVPGRSEPTAQDPDTRERALQLHRQLTAAVLAERQAIREVALCLAEMDRTRGYHELGYAGLAEYGERAFGFGTGKARQLARLGRKLPELPGLDRALATGAVGWTKARTVAQVATPETEDQWLAVALAQSSRELEDLAWRSHEGQMPSDPREEVDPPRYVHARFLMQMDHFELLMRALTRIQHLLGDLDCSASQLLLELAERELARLEGGAEGESEPVCQTNDSEPMCRTTESESESETETETEPETVTESGTVTESVAEKETEDGCSGNLEHVFHGGGSGGENAYRVNYRIVAHRCPECEKTWAETRGGRFELPQESRERVECDCEVVVGDDSAGTPGHLSRSIPPATRRAVLIRDGGHCQVPGCRNHRYLDLHHVLPRSRGGDHTSTNLVTVCSTHHELVHRDVIQVTRAPGGTLTWNRGHGEPLGLILALDNDRAEIGHDYLPEFDGPRGSWCLIEEPEEAREVEHVFAHGEPRGPTRFPRGRASFIIGDACRMATRDLYRPLPSGLG